MEEELEKERKIDRNGKPAHNKRYTLAAANRRLGVRSANVLGIRRFFVPVKMRSIFTGTKKCGGTKPYKGRSSA